MRDVERSRCRGIDQRAGNATGSMCFQTEHVLPEMRVARAGRGQSLIMLGSDNLLTCMFVCLCAYLFVCLLARPLFVCCMFIMIMLLVCLFDCVCVFSSKPKRRCWSDVEHGCVRWPQGAFEQGHGHGR